MPSTPCEAAARSRSASTGTATAMSRSAAPTASIPAFVSSESSSFAMRIPSVLTSDVNCRCGWAETLQRQTQDSRERNQYPAGPVIQLVGQFIKRFVNHVSLQQLLEQ